MQSLQNRLVFSATDLSSFLACPHLTLLKRRTAFGGLKPPFFDDPGIDVLRRRGQEHEQKFLSGLQKDGSLRIVDLTNQFSGSKGPERFERHAKATLNAMRDGADVIYQGMLFDGDWLGFPDFLMKVSLPSALGNWSYEVVDTKLAREAKGGALIQVLLYADLLTAVQGVAPDSVHLELGGPEAPRHSFRVKHYGAYYRSLRRRFLEWVAAAPAEMPLAVDPVAHCDICDWDYSCTRERRDVDHLSFVAGISRQQRKALVERGIDTLEALGGLDPVATRIDGIKPGSLGRIHHQARLQLEGRRQDKAIHELLTPVVPDQGLAALPVPSEGDLFFDLEGDPYAFDVGLEYLFGVADTKGEYVARWSLDQATERETFEWFMDYVTERLKQYPDLHIYHYASYEPSAMKKLAGRYDTRIEELDRLLRGRVFVDLFRVVRQGLRASVESYSIKKMEQFYQFERQVDLRAASSALGNFEAWLQLGGTAEDGGPLLAEIEGYNKDDCISTLKLRDWLESLRIQLATETGGDVPRASLPEDVVPPEQAEKLREIHALMARLMAGVPEVRQERSAEQHGLWLVAQILEYHRREAKSMWWQYFAWRAMSDDELLEDGAALAGMEYVGTAGTVDRSTIHRYRFPPQEHAIKLGEKTRDPATGKPAGDIVGFDEIGHTLDLKRGNKSHVAHPQALFPFNDVPSKEIHESLRRTAEAVANDGLVRMAPYESTVDLILAAAPRAGQADGDVLAAPGEESLNTALRLAGALDHSILPIQGPPGSGKTFTGARMILSLLKAGKKVGVTATSHQVISNLLQEVCKAAGSADYRIKGIQKAKEPHWCQEDIIPWIDDNGAILAALQSGEATIAAGTAWLWSREDMARSVDVLFIDEAGQFSLANALAVAPAAKSLVLLGDPQQLMQPQKGLHPPGTEVSALNHLLLDEATVPPERGLFLGVTWRLHPDICAFTSEIYYDGRLASRPGLELQRIAGAGELIGSGLRVAFVKHSDNQNESPEEVTEVVKLVDHLLNSGLTWVDRGGKAKTLGLSDILIVAAYNAQVGAIQQQLPAEARVGTVDKFQGKEAPIVIYSMASSSAEDAPRGMEFLYSPNRLNVATSRARCVVILVANERIFLPDCRTPEQMRLANGLCRYLELARL